MNTKIFTALFVVTCFALLGCAESSFKGQARTQKPNTALNPEGLPDPEQADQTGQDGLASPTGPTKTGGSTTGSNTNGGGSGTGGTGNREASGGGAPNGLVEDESKIPGTPVIKLGIGFNDSSFADRDDQDYNDAVVCFEGPFKYDPGSKTVLSAKTQTVQTKINSIAGCTHDIVIRVTHPGGQVETFVHDSHINRAVAINFRYGSRLDVAVRGKTSQKGCRSMPIGQEIPMQNFDWFRIDLNMCRDFGS